MNTSLWHIIGVIVMCAVHGQSVELTNKTGVCTRTVSYIDCKKNFIKTGMMYKLELYCCPGFFKNESTVRELHCIEGCSNYTYGQNCSLKCNCSNNAYQQCNIHDGTCVCREGWTGINCASECPKGYFGSNCSSVCPCQNNSTCDSVNGSCNCTDPGWTGIYCDQECQEGKYGYNCLNACNCNDYQTCDRRTGECRCKDGLTGTNCTTVCKNGTYGSGCSNQCECEVEGTESCDPVNGSCSCKPGKTGIMCEYECPLETYGNGCKNSCSCNNLQEYCRPSDGRCLKMCFCARNGTANCHDNYTDCNCKEKNQKCNSSNFLQDRFVMKTDAIVDICACKNDFDNICVPKNGTCICKHGYTGEWCNDVCKNGTYGSGCSNQCKCEVEGTESCNPVNGLCNCKPGITGIMCEYGKYSIIPINSESFPDAIVNTCAYKNDFYNIFVPKNGTSISKHGYTEELCNDVVSDHKAKAKSLIKDNNTVIIGLVIGSLTATVVIVIIVLLILRKTSSKKKVKKATSVSDPVLPDSIAKNDQFNEKTKEIKRVENTKLTETSEKANVAQIYEKDKVPQAYEKVKVPQIYEKDKVPQAYEKVKVPQIYEKANVPQAYEKAKVPQIYEKAKVSQIYEKAKVPQTYEKANVPQIYEKAKGPRAYEKANVPQIYEKAKTPQTKQMKNVKKYSNGAFEMDIEPADDVYNKLNHEQTSLESNYHSNENQSNMYGHLNTSYNVELDGDYDLMVHNKRSYTADDTYDHTPSKGQLYDTIVHGNL
ncbi:hypothetical protein KUTeg_023867 [Tegillarca granosa]|uniref:EGF-like domain-containing protein n=1 Tax=Tegillarca granosa TaxID=220873 RepID=A0ABQ9E7E8_TEGGR|nr:hypothetical protein KUTeg_023867 [Tegillarca granosa]